MEQTYFLVDLLVIFFRICYLQWRWYFALQVTLFHFHPPLLVLSLAVPLWLSLYSVDHRWVFRAEGVHQSMKSGLLSPQEVLLASLVKEVLDLPFSPWSPDSWGVCKAVFDSLFSM